MQKPKSSPKPKLVGFQPPAIGEEEIAAVTETPLGSVKGRLFRARQEMIEILRHNTYDWELPDERASA